jgi:oligosaccharide repeat unit polymerase
VGTATGVLVPGLLITALTLPFGSPLETFTYATNGAAVALVLSLAIELRNGLRAMLRTDIVMLLSLFGLTFLEFLIPHKEFFEFDVSAQAATDGSLAVLVGFIGIAIGRLFFPLALPTRVERNIEISPTTMFRLYLLVFFLGYLHIFLAVKFDVFEAIRQMTLPRFSQSWGRGRLGGWADLLVEVGALIFLIPPLAGCIYAQASRYSMLQKSVVSALLIFTLYYGFSGGTRNVFGTYLIAFCGAHLALQPKITVKKLVTFVAPVGAVALIGMYFMLEFRNGGLGNYSFSEAEFNGVFVDSNMIVISKLTEVFPRVHSYLGLEIPFHALIKPIPRAIWASKPEGLSVGIEDALGAEGLTLASTFIGEAYMAGGISGVLLVGLFFGGAAGRWNRMGLDLSSNYKLILYVSGFLAAAIGMRSLLSVAPTVLPTLALWLYGRLFLKQAPKSIRYRVTRQ